MFKLYLTLIISVLNLSLALKAHEYGELDIEITKNKVTVYDSANMPIFSKEIALAAPKSRKVFFKSVDQSAQFALVQRGDQLLIIDINKKSVTEVPFNIPYKLSAFASKSDETFFLGTKSGIVIELKLTGEGQKSQILVPQERKLPVKDIRISKDKKMFYIYYQKPVRDGIGFSAQSLHTGDLPTSRSPIGFRPRDLKPSGQVLDRIGFGDRQVNFDQRAFDILSQNVEARSTSRTSKLKIFIENATLNYSQLAEFNEFSSFMFLSNNLDSLILSDKINNVTSLFSLENYLKGNEYQYIFDKNFYHIIEKIDDGFVMANLDSKDILVFNGAKEVEKNDFFTKINLNSKPRAIFRHGENVYMIQEDGLVSRLTKKKVGIEIQSVTQVDGDLPRNIKLKKIKGNTLSLDRKNAKTSLKILLPKNCLSLFSKRGN